jgi:hypothetical protein
MQCAEFFGFVHIVESPGLRHGGVRMLTRLRKNSMAGETACPTWLASDWSAVVALPEATLKGPTNAI